MSERYNLILGHDLTCHAPVRRKYYNWMVLYLLFVGVVLIEGTYQIAMRVRDYREAAHASSALRDEASAQHGGAQSLKQVMKETIQLGAAQNATLAELSQMSERSIPFLPVLFEVHTTLPKGVKLMSLEMSPDEVSMVYQFSGEKNSTPELYLAQWRDNVVLNGYLEPLRVEDRDHTEDEGGKRKVQLTCVAVIKK